MTASSSQGEDDCWNPLIVGRRAGVIADRDGAHPTSTDSDGSLAAKRAATAGTDSRGRNRVQATIFDESAHARLFDLMVVGADSPRMKLLDHQ